jgi:sugar/nucleoside kinase (ribokinase family)
MEDQEIRVADVAQVTVSLLAKLKRVYYRNELGDFRVAVMHDFSFDRLVHLEDFTRFSQSAQTILSQTGGVFRENYQTIQQGGCAANTATALARLGIDTYFIARTDQLGLNLLEFYLKQVGVNISHVKLGGTLALSTALEVGPEKINIIIDDEKSFGPFGFDDLDNDDLELIGSCHMVGVFDWSANPYGTDLAGRLLDHLDGQQIPVYLDTSDPTPRATEIPDLFDRVFCHPALTYLSLNENELGQYTGSSDTTPLVQLIRLAQILKRSTSASLCVHTATYAMHVDNYVNIMPSYELDPLRTTGAGDSWNAGDIVGHLLGLEPAERLLLANAVAGYYVVSPQGLRPNLKQVIEFVESKQGQMRPLDWMR